ncbi:unnamed protein product [Acanthoscelides obtectus]|uniref:PiggyBac transposable element-derived protein domain-containing protein n=1 Tax=Acanthoscelides obtectus TaxID=200917 RepID=A0A9P0PN40_ACAOB|nr:unnamed protein product [Acanthoscelides obtectus]CAK1632927.1 PiggyBac transposable element-derived protein 4 [Acanthoscelides obtectus]
MGHIRPSRIITSVRFRRRPLTKEELQWEADHVWDESEDEEPFQDSGSEYNPSERESSESEVETNYFSDIDENGEESNVTNNDGIPDNTQNHNVPNPRTPNQLSWRVPDDNYIPRKALPPSNNSPATVLAAVNRSSSQLEVFLKLFPRCLFMFISQSTNERLNILNKTKHAKIDHTDPSEMMIVIGSLLVMSYNRVPNMQLYWSTNKSMGNEALKSAISRDRFLVLLSKLYFNNPSKPPDANKTYYIDEVVSCLKKTFIASRSDSSYQSIDESMAKFKGRSALKQYMPLKPIKRGIKIWQRCDALTGYVYDLNIYAGKETEQVEGTLGERVVAKLCDTIQNANVALCFDRFFTSVNLMTNIQFPAFGTCNSNRKSLPDFGKKLKERGAMEVYCSDTGLLATKILFWDGLNMSKFPVFWEGAGFIRYLEEARKNWSNFRDAPLQYNSRNPIQTRRFFDVKRQEHPSYGIMPECYFPHSVRNPLNRLHLGVGWDVHDGVGSKELGKHFRLRL